MEIVHLNDSLETTTAKFFENIISLDFVHFQSSFQKTRVVQFSLIFNFLQKYDFKDLLVAETSRLNRCCAVSKSENSFYSKYDSIVLFLFSIIS